MIEIHDGAFLDKEKLFGYLRYNSYLSERYKLFYIATPKVACTSLKWWFAALEGYTRILRGSSDSAETDPDLVIHDTFHKIAPNVTGLMPETLSEILASNSYFRFAVVRNPYKRIFSAWQSKLLLREPYQVAPYLQCDFFHHSINCVDNIAAAFEGFLEHLAANEAPSYWDVHWTPQASLLRPDLIKYSKLVKIENSKELSEALAEHLGEYIPDPFINHHANESLIPYLPELITERSSELIRLLYAEDFETFGYSKQPPEARKSFSTGQFDLAFKAISLIRARHQRLGERNGQLASLNQVVTERDGQLANLNQALVERDGQLANLNQALVERDGQLANLNQALVERDGQLANLNQALVERDGQLANLNQALVERDGQLANLNQALAERDGQLANLNQALAERDGHLANLNQALAERGVQIANLNHVVAELDEQIVNLDQTVSERDGQITNLNQTLSSRDIQIARLNQTIADRDMEIAALRSSNSWRITKPLRLTSLLLRGKQKEVLSFESRTLKQLDSREGRSHQESTQRYKQLTQSLHELPDSFDQDLYLKLNPDLAKAGVDPTDHYLLHGRHEGRICSLPDIHTQAIHDFNADRDTILVVSHEASRTGAPVLSLNLVQTLVESHNVVVLLLGGGPLSDAFELAGAAVMTASSLKGNPVLAHLIVGQLCERFNFKFALVNSIESRAVLPALGCCFVPTISLLHEFASYTRPRHAFREALFWSGETVFSANVTMENAFAEYPDLGKRYAHILPQGRCHVPLDEFSEEELQAERAHIRRLIRPKDIAEDLVVVLGAGFVQLRKGVDLFIECAARVVHTSEGHRCRFVWIGKGYDPDNDVGYSVYLADQIRRAGLEEHVFFVNETTAIETAYEEADLLLLSSRLDPLPNVAIDAMAHGVPVLCFNKTTGIADFLIESGLKNHCVAEYLDSVDMAGKILALAGSQELYEDVAGRCREASMAYFSMKEYVVRLEALAQDICVHTKQEKADTQEILASGLFRRDFSCSPHWYSESIEADVRAYVRAWSSGIDRRKPFPSFDPGIYQEQHGLATDGADPFADYLRAGQPDGPWNYPVIVASDIIESDLPDNQRVALHLHVYYPELLPEITARLSHNRICPDLFISVANEEARDRVAEELRDYRGNVVDIQIVPGRGRDIGPFLTAFGQRISTYDFVGHIHTKKSADVKDASVGKIWYRFLLENLLGGESCAMADSILARMESDASIGMVFPDDPNIVGWNDNRAIAETIAECIGLDKLPEHFIFPIGTMFWAKTSALAPLMNLKLDWDDYPEEPLPYDGTLLHALERLFSLSLSVSNLRSAVTNVIGLTR